MPPPSDDRLERAAMHGRRPYALSLALPGTCLAALAALAAAMLFTQSSATAQGLPGPPEGGPLPKGLQTAVLAGGCFWGIEAVFEHVKGVKSAVAGYAGGTRQTANYRAVSSERTGHAEAVRIVYDPTQIRFGQLLHIFFAVAHDPTQVNRQTPDTGPSYRSAIFPQTPEQRRIAGDYIARLNAAHSFRHAIATKLETGTFYKAEGYHQDFAKRNPRNAYIMRWDAPKVSALKKAFPTLYRP